MTQWGLDNLFNPGKRHMDDEKRRLQSTREEVGDASGGRRIDLESGRVSIAVPGRGASAAGEELAPALEAEGAPDIALASDADVEPAVTGEPDPDLAPDPGGDPDEGAPADDDATAPDREVTAAPAQEPEPAEPAGHTAAAPTPSRRLSAAAWARRG